MQSFLPLKKSTIQPAITNKTKKDIYSWNDPRSGSFYLHVLLFSIQLKIFTLF